MWRFAALLWQEKQMIQFILDNCQNKRNNVTYYLMDHIKTHLLSQFLCLMHWHLSFVFGRYLHDWMNLGNVELCLFSKSTVSLSIMPYPTTSFSYMGPLLPPVACMLGAKQSDTVVSRRSTEDTNVRQIRSKHAVTTYGGACHTFPLLLSLFLSDRVISTSTLPMSSPRLFGSFKDNDISLTLKQRETRCQFKLNRCRREMGHRGVHTEAKHNVV